METHRPYHLAHGFSFRKESFGGILYHYEGIHPDPRLYFVESPFLVALLEIVRDHPEQPLGDILTQVRDHFSLDSVQVEALHDFFHQLTERGALVPQ